MIGGMSVLKIDEGEGAGTQLFTLELRSRSHMGVVWGDVEEERRSASRFDKVASLIPTSFIVSSRRILLLFLPFITTNTADYFLRLKIPRERGRNEIHEMGIG